MPEDRGTELIAATCGDGVVLTVDQHCLDVSRADSDRLHRDELTALVTERGSGEPGANQIPHPVEALTHAKGLGEKGGWRRTPG
jgi:hypothetical protein